eukprot:445845_1
MVSWLPFLLLFMAHAKHVNYQEYNVSNTIMPIAAVTSVASDCDYHSNDIYTTSTSKQVFNSIIIKHNTMTIEFDIQLHDYCNSSTCTILHLSNNNSVGNISLSINGLQNYFQISKIKIYLTITPNIPYKLYISSPLGSVVNYSVTNICIQSLTMKDVNIDKYAMCENLNCGDIVSGMLKGQRPCYKLSLINSRSLVYFESDASQGKVTLELNDVNDTFIAELTNDNQKITMLKSGHYILNVNSYSCPYNVYYTSYMFHTICTENI